jgi:hypothetical protein
VGTAAAGLCCDNVIVMARVVNSGWSKSVLLVALIGTAPLAQGCDLCGCYTPQVEAIAPAQEAAGEHGGWLDHSYFAIAEQFTHFGTVQLEGRQVPNPSEQFLDSSITQLVAGYSFTSRFALQINVPLIYRSFERPEGFAVDRGTESGLGDVSLLAKLVVFHHESGGARRVVFDDPKNPRMEAIAPDFTISALLLGGAKFPTGDSSRIKEEFNETEVPGAPQSGIHGHDLTLGTASYDAILGGQTSLRYRSFFFEADGQFMLRGDGLHQYHFANDLSWSGGPGYYLIRKPSVVVGVQCVCSGEHKGVDRFQGKAAEDTGITSVFLGPRVTASIGKVSGEIAAEFPLSIDNTALQVVPDYRLRASIGARF